MFTFDSFNLWIGEVFSFLFSLEVFFSKNWMRKSIDVQLIFFAVHKRVILFANVQIFDNEHFLFNLFRSD